MELSFRVCYVDSHKGISSGIPSPLSVSLILLWMGARVLYLFMCVCVCVNATYKKYVNFQFSYVIYGLQLKYIKFILCEEPPIQHISAFWLVPSNGWLLACMSEYVCECTSMLFRQLKKLKDYIKCAIWIIFCHSENIQYTLCLDDVDDGGASGVIIIVVTRVLNLLVPFSISASNNQLLSNKHSQCFDVPHFQLISRTRTNI